MDKLESQRLHEDWWGKCRTCRFWNGADKVSPRPGTVPLVQLRWEPAKCENPRSPMRGKEMWIDGHCPQWDSFDVDTALEVISSEYRSPFTEVR